MYAKQSSKAANGHPTFPFLAFLLERERHMDRDPFLARPRWNSTRPCVIWIVVYLYEGRDVLRFFL